MKKIVSLILILMLIVNFTPKQAFASSDVITEIEKAKNILNEEEYLIYTENVKYGIYENLTFEEKIMVTKEVNKTIKEIKLSNALLNMSMTTNVIGALSTEYTSTQIAYIYRTHKGQAQKIYKKYLEYRSIPGSSSYTIATAYKNSTFIKLVKTGGEWDLKKFLGSSKTYRLLGHTRTGEYIGNHHFGFMGRHLGYSLTALKIGAGIYQIVSGTSDWSYMSHYFDDPRDAAAIESGFYAWKNF